MQISCTIAARYRPADKLRLISGISVGTGRTPGRDGDDMAEPLDTHLLRVLYLVLQERSVSRALIASASRSPPSAAP